MNTRIVLANRPAEGPIPANTFKQEQKPVPKKEDLKDGEVIVRVMWLSLVGDVDYHIFTSLHQVLTGQDPAMRGWLRDARSKRKKSAYIDWMGLTYTASQVIFPPSRSTRSCGPLVSGRLSHRNAPSVKLGMRLRGHSVGRSEFTVICLEEQAYRANKFRYWHGPSKHTELIQ